MVRVRYDMCTENAVSLLDALEWLSNRDPRGVEILSVFPAQHGINLFKIVYRWEETYDE